MLTWTRYVSGMVMWVRRSEHDAADIINQEHAEEPLANIGGENVVKGKGDTEVGYSQGELAKDGTTTKADEVEVISGGDDGSDGEDSSGYDDGSDGEDGEEQSDGDTSTLTLASRRPNASAVVWLSDTMPRATSEMQSSQLSSSMAVTTDALSG